MKTIFDLMDKQVKQLDKLYKKTDMKNLTDINWNVELDLNLNEDNDTHISEEAWYVSFTYNGRNLKAVINFSVDFYTYSERDLGYTSTDVEDTYVEVVQIWDEEEDELIFLDTKELINIENQLETDLKTEY